jgi:hypothetical protein
VCSSDLHFERKFLSWTLKEFIFFPVDYKTEQEKEEKHGLKFYVNISPWWNQGFPNWYLEIK